MDIRIRREKLFSLSTLRNYHLAQATHETQVKLVKCKESHMEWKSKDGKKTQGETLGLTSNSQGRHLAMQSFRAATTQMQVLEVLIVAGGDLSEVWKQGGKKSMWFFEII